MDWTYFSITNPKSWFPMTLQTAFNMLDPSGISKQNKIKGKLKSCPMNENVRLRHVWSQYSI